MTTEHDDKNALREAQKKATRVPVSLAAKIRELDSLTEQRRPDPVVERRYKELKDEIYERLEGVPALVYTQDGEPRYATRFNSTTLQVDVALLEKIMQELGYTEEEIDRVLPREVNLEALRRIIRLTRSKELMKRHSEFAREVPYIHYVKFSDPLSDNDDSDNEQDPNPDGWT